MLLDAFDFFYLSKHPDGILIPTILSSTTVSNITENNACFLSSKSA